MRKVLKFSDFNLSKLVLISAKKIRTRHFRNGVEQEPIQVDDHYDFNYQSFRIPRKSKVILPGDQITVECDYDTRGAYYATLVSVFPHLSFLLSINIHVEYM